MVDKKWLATAGLLLGMGTAHAGNVGVGVVAGTLGVGGQLSYSVGDHLALRALFSTNVDFEADGGSDLAYDGNVDLFHSLPTPSVSRRSASASRNR